MTVYNGSCHCGRIKFQVDFDFSKSVTCNCSICSKTGAVYATAQEDQLQITQGQEDLTLYQFGTKTAKHYFCKHCGIHPFLRPRIAPGMWAVNLLCLEGVNLQNIPTEVFDGQNWEETARAWLKRS